MMKQATSLPMVDLMESGPPELAVQLVNRVFLYVRIDALMRREYLGARATKKKKPKNRYTAGVDD